MDSSKGFLVGLAALLAVVSAAFVRPYLQFVLLAVMLAYLLRPLQTRLAPRLGHRPATILLVLAATLVVILPLVALGRIVVAEGLAVVRAVRRGDITLVQFETILKRTTGIEVDLAEILRSAASTAGTETLGSVLGAFGAVTHFLFGLGLTVFLLYYLLKDWAALADWLGRILPLTPARQQELYAELDAIMWAVLVGHAFVAAVQGILAGIGFLVVGVPSALFWTVVMALLALLPVVGSFLVWGPAVGWLVLVGDPLAAVFLLGWGSIVVGLSDNYLRPLVVDRYARLNPAVIVVGLVGGLSVVGVMGLFFGPIVIGALRATLDVLHHDTRPDS